MTLRNRLLYLGLGIALYCTAASLTTCQRTPTGHQSQGTSTATADVAPQQEVVDLAGRKVTLSVAPGRVLTFGHSFSILVALAPDLLVARPGPFKANPDAFPFLPPAVRSLPQLGTGPGLDLEQIKAAHFDLAVGWDSAAFRREQMQQLERIGLPVVLVGVDRIEQYPATFRLLGQALGRAARGEALARRIEELMAQLAAKVAAVPARARLRVYYAEGMDGLTSQCGLEGRAEALRLAGATNVVRCEEQVHPSVPADIENHNAPLDLETLITLDPDAIVTRFPKAADTMLHDPRWSKLRAVRQKRVYAIPQLPFNWFDRPPSYMRVLGAKWLAARLYPAQVAFDLDDDVTHFFELFFGVTPTSEQLSSLLGSHAP
jgi:iron complex transport system substrate-binding protein